MLQKRIKGCCANLCTNIANQLTTPPRRLRGQKGKEMLYTIHTSYKEFDDYLGGLRLCCRTEKIDAPDPETAKAIAWKRALTENPNRILDEQSARKSHRR